MRSLALVVLTLSLIGLPSSAQAATVQIPGDPMVVHVSDVGRVTARLAGDPTNVFFSPSDNDSPDAGFTLGFPEAVGTISAASNFGPVGSEFTPVSQGTLTGTGTLANPYRVTTVYSASDGTTVAAEVTQVVTYVSGDSKMAIAYSVRNPSSVTPVKFRAGEYADLYLAGSDVGTGVLDPGPPRLVGGLNADGRTGGIQEVPGSPWDHFEENTYSIVRANLANLAGQGLADAVNAVDELDNGVAVQWDDFFASGLAPLGTATFNTVWTFAGLFIGPQEIELPRGGSHNVTLTLRNPSGSAVTGTPVRYTITGANPRSGTSTTDGNGRAAISWVGTAAGLDTVTAYADLNGNGSKEAGEPAATATALWLTPGSSPPPTGNPGGASIDNSVDGQLARLPAPALAKTVNVAPVAGEVFVKLPGTSAVHAAQAKGRGFLPLRQARQIPVGSTLDTRKGAVRLVSAANAAGGKQQGDFNGGLFTTVQTRAGKGLTELRMTSGSFSRCTVRGKQSTASAAARRFRKRTVRRLRGNAKGRFRTRGRYASATVRGTDWTVTDRCDGTLTKVRSGTVVVRDLRKKKNYVVRAGKSRLVRR